MISCGYKKPLFFLIWVIITPKRRERKCLLYTTQNSLVFNRNKNHNSYPIAYTYFNNYTTREHIWNYLNTLSNWNYLNLALIFREREFYRGKISLENTDLPSWESSCFTTKEPNHSECEHESSDAPWILFLSTDQSPR